MSFLLMLTRDTGNWRLIFLYQEETNGAGSGLSQSER